MIEQNKQTALSLLKEFTNDPYVVNQGVKEPVNDFDKKRNDILQNLNNIIKSYFDKSISLQQFKKEIDSLNKQYSYWGFRGVNGQMFFNMLYKSAKNLTLLDDLILTAIKLPKDIHDAKNKINSVIMFVKDSSNELDKRKVPRQKSILFFLSYFWQIQNPKLWPIFYNSLEQIFIELGFLELKDDLASYYENFYNLNYELLNLFKKDVSSCDFWFVEHVFWRYFNQKTEIIEPTKIEIQTKKIEKTDFILEYIPPVISNIIELSLNESTSSEFEKKTVLLFQMMGFDTELKGQGKGRTVDLIARANLTKPYILLVDCKARSGKEFKFTAGEERTVIEYIKNFISNNPRDRSLEIHYLIISSGFKNDDEAIRRKIKSETGVDVSFVTIQDLLFLFVKKLQNWDLDLEIMKTVFQREGLITKDIIQDVLGR